jgi:uncharacterized protein (TIGR04255 family)
MALDLPEPDTSVLTNAPLEYVVCQVRFDLNPAVSGGQFAATFQEALGGLAGPYPLVRDAVGTSQITMTISPTGPTTESKAVTGWQFASADGLWSVQLLPESVALETTGYTDWSDFHGRMEAVLEAVRAVVNPAFEQRVGLRFVDRIHGLGVTTAFDWQPHMSDHLLGAVLHPGIGPAVLAAHQQLVIDIDDGASCTLRHGPLPGRDDRDGLDYLLDFDLHRDGGRPFDAPAIVAALDQFNRRALQLFQACVDPTLLDTFR